MPIDKAVQNTVLLRKANSHIEYEDSVQLTCSTYSYKVRHTFHAPVYIKYSEDHFQPLRHGTT